MDARDEATITTDELLGRLGRRGLRVTRTMLAQDVRAGHLPPLTKAPRGPRQGIGRLWEPWAVRRALYLYRLRKRGTQGDLLRVLLFLHDGRGWDAVKPICLLGLTKLVRIQGRAVTGRLRHPTPTNLDFLAEEFAAGEFASSEVARFVWGLGFFGQPLPGGSLLPLFEALRSVLGVGYAGDEIEAGERMLARLGLSWEGALALVEAADAAQAAAARRQFLASVRHWRGVYQAYLQQHGHRGQSTNPLTLCGRPGGDLQAAFRSLPGRPTPAQLLAALLVPFLVLEGLRRSGELPEPEGAAAPP